MLLTIYMKRIYNTDEGQKHFVLCDAAPALRHFFLFYFISQYINCEFFYLYLKLGMCIAVYISE